MKTLNLKTLENKRDLLLYTVYNKITKRVMIEKSKVWYKNEVEAITEKYETVYSLLSSKINSLDFIICSIKLGTKHDADVWNYELKRALA